jgi:hypothetical protein
MLTYGGNLRPRPLDLVGRFEQRRGESPSAFAQLSGSGRHSGIDLLSDLAHI